MRNVLIIYFDSLPEGLLRTVSNIVGGVKALSIDTVSDIPETLTTPNIVLVVLPLSSLFDHDMALTDIMRKFKRPIFVIDHEFRPLHQDRYLRMGVDRYFSVPVSFSQLRKYIDFYSMSGALESNDVLEYKGLTLDVGRRIAQRGNRIIRLRNKEFELLKMFMRNPGIVITKRRFLESIWDINASMNTTTVETHISHLRKKIEDDKSEKLLHTIHCVGYKLE